MKKVTLVLFCFLLVNSASNAQDLLILKDGSDIQVKVLEVLVDEIKYKKFSNIDGPTYTMEKDFVFMIKYANGEKDLFGNSPKPEKVESTPEKKKFTPNKGHFITISGGCAIPIDAYASTSASSMISGYALPGYNAAIQGAYFIIPYIGIGASAGVFGNQLNMDKIIDQSVGNANVSKSYTSVSYTNIYFGGGPYFQLPTKFLNISINGFIGGNYLIGPEYSVTLTNGTGYYKATLNYDNAIGLSYGGGLDFRLKVSRLISIGIGTNFIMSRTQHKSTQTATGYQSRTEGVDAVVQVININGGLVFNLEN